MKHTLGPWKQSVSHWSEIKGGNGLIIAEIEYGPPVSPPYQEAEGNACLIVAAPELLDACETMLGYMDSAKTGIDEYGGDCSDVEAFDAHVTALIAKAKGETP